MGVNHDFGATWTTCESIQALQKAISACQLIGIDYLWIDQLCINQFDNFEQGQEVSKMRQYYGNASTTLVAIDAE